MDLQLHDKTVLVTGSSKGIGAAIARQCAAEGARVVVHGRDRAQAEQVTADITRRGGRAHTVLGDLTDPDAVARLVAHAQAQVGRIDILVNNAGGSGGIKETWASTVPATWTAAYERNVLAALRVTNLVLPAMRAARWGRIINISSLAATMAPAAGPDYAACKAALNAMTASMAKAVADDGVTVNAVSPGAVHSDALDRAFRQAASLHGVAADAPWADVERAVLPLFAQVPMGRVGNVDDIANAVMFLSSPLSGYITGTNLRVDGGMSPVL